MEVKKQSASTIRLFSIDKDMDQKQAIEAIKNALIGLGLRYVPDNKKKK